MDDDYLPSVGMRDAMLPYVVVFPVVDDAFHIHGTTFRQHFKCSWYVGSWNKTQGEEHLHMDAEIFVATIKLGELKAINFLP